MLFLKIFFTYVFIEFLIQYLLSKNKKKNTILVNKDDEIPKFDKKRYDNFLKNSYDKKLGWIRKKNTKGFDSINGIKINFSIDKKGYRKFKKRKKNLFASFGDSYVFCRQVKDNETWQEQLSSNKKFNILNYGVGNYGLDQSILRYKDEKLDNKVKFILMGFVPETICRIQSQWKHYLEFGNIHGFKPKFTLVNEKIKLITNPLKKKIKIDKLTKVIKEVSRTDRFYEEKFQKNIFKFPFVFSFCKNLTFNLKVFFLIILKEIKISNLSEIKLNDLLFSLVMKRNIEQSHDYYNENKSIKLFEKIIDFYKNLALKKNHIPIIIVFPQLMDLKLNSRINYQRFFLKLNNKIKVIDLTKLLLKKDIKKIYTNDKYGGHLSKYGNKVVSQFIFKELKKYYKYIDKL